MGHFINLLCSFLGHKKGQTWEYQGENSVCKRCGVVYKSGLSYYKQRSFYDASHACGMNESIYRSVDIYTKYAKNHTMPLQKRVPLLDRLCKDWIIWDGKED